MYVVQDKAITMHPMMGQVCTEKKKSELEIDES